jgi:hypothetical protein
MVRYILEQCVFLYDTYLKYGSAGKYRENLVMRRVPSRQTIHNLVNKLKKAGLFKRRMLTEEKLDDIGPDLNIHLENHRNV